MQPQQETKEKISLEIIIVRIIRIGFTSTAINELYSCSMWQNILKYMRHITLLRYFSQPKLAKHIETL